MLKNLAKDYKKAFLLIIDNKWLYGTVIFFVLCDVATKIPALIFQKTLLSATLGNTFPYDSVINQYLQQSFSEKIYYAVQSIHPLTVLSSMTFPALFSAVGLVIAFLIFYKRIGPLRSTSFCKKVSFYAFLVLILSIVIGLVAYFFLQNQAIIILCAITSLVSFEVLFIVLLSIIESLFISLMVSLFSGETILFESISKRSIEFTKTLFIFNVVIYFVSTKFVAQLSLLPGFLHMIMPNVVGSPSGIIMPDLISNVSWFVYYFHSIFVIVFVLAPLTMAISSYHKFTPVLKESVLIARREIGYYLSLVVWTLLLIFILIALSNIINPSVLAISRPIAVEILIGAIYSLLFTLVLVTFYVTAFRKILGLSGNS
jgi:hypothetical protein